MSNWKSACVEIGFKDFASICRVCFAKNNLRNFQVVEYLVDVLQSLTDTEISENDGLPQNICVNCIKKLEDISDFMDLSKYNDTVLRQVYLTQFNLKTNTVVWASKDDVQLDTNTNKETVTECTAESNVTYVELDTNTNKETVTESTADSNVTSDNSNSNNKAANGITCESEILEDVEEENEKEDVEEENEKEEMSHDDHTTESEGSSCKEPNRGRKLSHKNYTRYRKNDTISHRREQNRKAAAKCRKKLRDRVSDLEQTVECLEKANAFLKQQKQELETESTDLVKALARFRCSKKHHVVVKPEKETPT